jgi:heat shock protein HtpX
VVKVFFYGNRRKKINGLKTMGLMVSLTLLLLFVGAALGGRNGMTIALSFAFAMNFITYWFSDKIVLRMYKAKQVTEAETPDLFGTVRRLAQKTDPRIYIMKKAFEYISSSSKRA